VVYGRSDLPGPLCNLYLSRSGEVYLVAAGIGYHAGNTLQPWQDNNSAIGIEAEATGVDPWPPASYDAYTKLCSALFNYYRLPVNHVVGHKEICDPPGRKIDPNFDMNAFRTTVSKGGGGVPAAPLDFPDDEENQMLFKFGTPAADGKTKFTGQRTCEAGGGSNVAKAAWISFSSAWGGCNVAIAALDGKGKVTWVFGNATTKPYVKNNTNVPLQMPEGSRIVTVEGIADTGGTIPACDVYNLR
jgi:hypothetical protein